ncbi:hypothetical protein [Evansella tamaricis]|uniref:Uncharacterized protein n=1 Tax=Evansella tamaricis TaxID=2069301 RepID=A0ABS6JA06_9BACI|nr:hypothetical protein [Evansella tamaricis]MBU9710511.1 hypothetical protein [Evansella tamaricis]
MDYELVTSLDEVVQNIKQFNSDLSEELDVISQLSQFKHWYFIPQINLFGPSKYIGYKDMNTSRYNRGRSKTGVDTEKELKTWFIKLSRDSENSKKLMTELEAILACHNKKTRTNAHIHILKNGINLKIE